MIKPIKYISNFKYRCGHFETFEIEQKWWDFHYKERIEKGISIVEDCSSKTALIDLENSQIKASSKDCPACMGWD